MEPEKIFFFLPGAEQNLNSSATLVVQRGFETVPVVPLQLAAVLHPFVLQLCLFPFLVTLAVKKFFLIRYPTLNFPFQNGEDCWGLLFHVWYFHLL